MILNENIILIKAGMIKDKFYPIWEFNFNNYSNYDDCEPLYYHQVHNGISLGPSDFKDVYYNINEKVISTGKVIDYFEKSTENKKVYSKGDKIHVEKDHHKIFPTHVEEVIWNNNQNIIMFGKNIKEECPYYVDDISMIEDNQLYHIKCFSPKYKVKGIEKIIWDYSIYEVLN